MRVGSTCACSEDGRHGEAVVSLEECSRLSDLLLSAPHSLQLGPERGRMDRRALIAGAEGGTLNT
jgi:hypothetical protein